VRPRKLSLGVLEYLIIVLNYSTVICSVSYHVLNIFLLIAMVGKNKIGEKILSKVRTFYMAPSDVEVLDAVAAAMGMNRSGLIRYATAPLIEKFKTGEIKKPKFDYDGKNKERLSAKTLEERQLKILTGEVCKNKQSAYDTLKSFAKSLGTDDSLTKGIDKVLEKLKLYDCTGKEPFNDSTLMTFIMYLDAVLKRRAIDAEIKSHWRGVPEAKIPKADVPKLEENPLVA
jgi:hypothetical protein